MNLASNNNVHSLFTGVLDTLSLAGCTSKKSEPVFLGNFCIAASQSVNKDWNFYSKAWHRSHGPKTTIDDRTLSFTREFRGKLKTVSVPVAAWRGDFLAKAVIELGLAPKKSRYSLRIRLNAAYDAKKLSVKRGYTIYSRTLLGDHVDYVIESPLGMIYHDVYRKRLIKGLHNKIRAQARKLEGLIDWATCKKLGFCTQGIRSFCDDFGFHEDGAYTLREIESAVKKYPRRAVPYQAELLALSKAMMS